MRPLNTWWSIIFSLRLVIVFIVVRVLVKKTFFIVSLTAMQMYIAFVCSSYPLINKCFGTVFAQVAI